MQIGERRTTLVKLGKTHPLSFSSKNNMALFWYLQVLRIVEYDNARHGTRTVKRAARFLPRGYYTLPRTYSTLYFANEHCW